MSEMDLSPKIKLSEKSEDYPNRFPLYIQTVNLACSVFHPNR